MLPISATAAGMGMMISISAISSHGVRAVLLSTVAKEAGLLTPEKFYKRSREKNTSSTAGFFLGFQPTPLSRIVLAFRSVISGRCPIRAARLAHDDAIFFASKIRAAPVLRLQVRPKLRS